MKFFQSLLVVLTAFLFSCGPTNTQDATTVKTDTSVTQTSVVSTNKDDIKAIQDLVRKMLVWSETRKSVDLLPAVTNEKDTVYSGFDLDKLKLNLAILKASGFFSAKFIENYNQIILTLDKELRNKELPEWNVNDLPPFRFVNDIDPWCLCQDVPYDKPNAFELVEVEPLNLTDTKGVLIWKWGNPETNNDPGWKDFSYKFEVEKEDGVWKISYLQGFDFNESIKKDGL